MLQKSINNYCPKISLLTEVLSNSCFSINKHESILYLKNPKLLYDLTEDSSNTLEVEIPNIINVPYSIKNEKKSKSDFKSLDTVENKKYKLRQKKKVRSKIHIDKNFSNTNEDLELNEIRKLPLLRTPKNLKNKKINKNKVIVSNDIMPDVIDSTSSLSLNYSKHIYLDNLLTVQELAEKLNIPSTEIIKWLFLQGISVTINQLLDLSILTLIAEHYSFVVVQEKNTPNPLKIDSIKQARGQLRSPVITILGHVDHGKTTLLNVIRKNSEFNKETGSITQSIGSYEVMLDHNKEIKKLIFLDTPGHEAFISMRRRGAEITDLVILVVSADDGLKPQTVEAIDHIRSRNLPFVVAISKIDKIDANIDKVKKQLSAFNINSKDSGGTVPIVAVSAVTGENIDLLLSNLLILSDAQNLRSDPSQQAEGIILEAYLDRQRGPVAKILIQDGTLSVGNIMVAGNIYGKVKAIEDSFKCKVASIKSTTLAEVLCFPNVPEVGLSFKVVQDEKMAKSQSSSYIASKIMSNSLNNRIALEALNINGGNRVAKQINIIIKTDVQGSIDPIIHTLSKIPQEKVQVNILSVASGEISLKDIQLASTSNSIILAFNINISSAILNRAENAGIIVKHFNIIYDLVDYIKDYMLTFVEIEYTEEVLGHAEVRDLFHINKGVVAGCFILDGKLKKNAYINITRKGQIIYSGLFNSLKRVKEDVEEVLSGNECGLMCKDYNLWQVNDQIEAYTRQPLEKTL
uniref:translation initiation factor 2 n=1 Tax=Lithothamnion corallioides TaxID=1277934 RepID=UPI0023F3E990|nr:translation initiation factor 2 [Lithothamnion corallioides]WEA76988.1 translation initiation factor 2 [Lithothamnion corallioides]